MRVDVFILNSWPCIQCDEVLLFSSYELEETSDFGSRIGDHIRANHLPLYRYLMTAVQKYAAIHKTFPTFEESVFIWDSEVDLEPGQLRRLAYRDGRIEILPPFVVQVEA